MHNHILIIDDDQRFVNSLKMSLSDEYTIHEAQDISKSISTLKDYPVSTILLDYSLGLENGHTVYDQIRSQGFNTPIIVISGSVDLNMSKGFLKRHISGFFEKPFLVSELRQKLNEVHHHQDRENLLLRKFSFVLNEHK